MNSENKFVENEYGFVCVPVGTTFASGKKYKFTLDICGEQSGAGYYPPEENFSALLPADKSFTSNWNQIYDNLIIVDRPTTKEVGDLVLDEPIKFSVSVSSWVDDATWTDGNVKLD